MIAEHPTLWSLHTTDTDEGVGILDCGDHHLFVGVHLFIVICLTCIKRLDTFNCNDFNYFVVILLITIAFLLRSKLANMRIHPTQNQERDFVMDKSTRNPRESFPSVKFIICSVGYHILFSSIGYLSCDIKSYTFISSESLPMYCKLT